MKQADKDFQAVPVPYPLCFLSIIAGKKMAWGTGLIF
jgi:hypothetical protein